MCYCSHPQTLQKLGNNIVSCYFNEKKHATFKKFSPHCSVSKNVLQISEILSWVIFGGGGYCWLTWTLDQHLLICFPSQGREIQNICLFLGEVMDKHNFIIPFSKGSTEKINILKIPSLWFFFPFCKNIWKSIALNNLPTLL